MKTILEYLVNNRSLTTFRTIESELSLNRQKNYLFDLSYLGVIDLFGDKSTDFLQGQLTCDLRLVTNTSIIQGAQCNLKGRILSLLDIINWHGVKLVLPQDLIEVTQHSLNKAALLSRVKITANNSYKVLGFYLQHDNDQIPQLLPLPNELYALSYSSRSCVYHLGKGFYIYLIHSDYYDSFCKPFNENNQLLGSLTWHTLRLFDNQIDIYPNSRGLFLPHRIGLHRTSYISLDKGCYKGQEIIARTHYRATLKHELKKFVIQTDSQLYSGQKLFKSDENTEIGELVDYSMLGQNRYLVAASILKENFSYACLEGDQFPIQLEEKIEFES
ncbi:folate-binding protein YgfZ [Legionella sp. PATHC032]|uniref:CAF17-like 4Fe-4S cluster assembly/insertion protein YgfZ n=1 Tax=Legionella sp. PATHC032 TaxID=2992039 RepID=UPI001B2E57B2|nr:folate-binding protein YgfZ [Legionella sp. PATHC032]MCW8421464.1 folate-binding protein YgfZ [Legionella sp. PATHC032]HAZ7572599.1 folate-binding protein YgfZ [Legionella pneumophila]HBA1633953.1 folate-binding protein YgfZ [Legionella pneumophila]